MINRQASRNPRRLPYPEEIRKTTEPVDQPADSTAADSASKRRWSDHTDPLLTKGTAYQNLLKVREIVL